MTPEALAAANRVAQQAFHEMLVRKTYSDPEAPETIEYVRAERLVDDLLGELQWEASKAAMDELQAADHDYHRIAGGPVEECADCQEAAAQTWEQVLQPY